MPESTNKTPSMPSAWKQAVADHRKPVLRTSVWQLVNSLIPYIALWGLMIWTLDISYWITLVLAVAAAGFGRLGATRREIGSPRAGAGEHVPSC